MTAAAADRRDRLSALLAENGIAVENVGSMGNADQWLPDYALADRLIAAGVTLADSPQPEADSPALDVAWRAVEAALPEGWVVDGLRRLYDNGHDGRRFVARAVRPTPIGERDDGWVLPLRFAIGPTPTAALRALAEKLLADDAARGGERPG